MVHVGAVLSDGGGPGNDVQPQRIHETTAERFTPPVQLGAWSDRLPRHRQLRQHPQSTRRQTALNSKLPLSLDLLTMSRRLRSERLFIYASTAGLDCLA